MKQYFEDFAVGQTFGSGKVVMDAGRIKAFARQYDPQPFHMDETAAAQHPIFRGLAASGWHTAAEAMRLFVESEFQPAGGIIGNGFDEFRWPRPVRPDDELHLAIEVLDVRLSKSRPDQGVVKARMRTLNQRDEEVMVLVAHFLVPKRPR